MSDKLEILKILYDDALSPSVRNVGKALGLLTDSAFHLLRINKLEQYNLKKNIILQRNLEKIKHELSEENEENIIEIAPEISIPLIERLSYTQEESLSDLFVELLRKSASKNDVSKVHPSFIRLIDSLSPDDALIIDKISELKHIYLWRFPKVSYGLINPDPKAMGQKFTYGKYFCRLNYDIDNMRFQNNTEMYIENLISLGVLEAEENRFLPQIDQKTGRNIPLSEYELLREKSMQTLTIAEGATLQFFSENGILSVTNYGQKFIAAIKKT